jgi:hypothetical protein
MKTTFAVLALALAGQTHAVCDAQTIEGNYSAAGLLDTFAVSNDNQHSNLIFHIGRVYFDGDRRVTLKDAKFSIGGQTLRGTGVGTYSVRTSCSGVMTMNMKANFNGDAVTGRVRYDMIVSGFHDNPRIDAIYTDILPAGSIGDSGLIVFRRIGF